ncbi:MAG: UDP-N-acetylglucosamine 2-epimerase (non-hydrolyzing) [Chloroflexi bacterium]|nr:UDP-N-acetylglucosamine 2-epimerase (non-hydrolyzing) [Chloroflexota bacterium]
MAQGRRGSGLKVLFVMGTRPEATKLAPIVTEMCRRPEVEAIVCSTAQHREMLDQVVRVMEIPVHYDLDVMQDNQGLFELTTTVLLRLRSVLEEVQPHIVLVQGDTTTAMVATLASYYLKIPVGHVEAGLRTGDKYNPFPEEINRKLIDAVADLCFAPTEGARTNLRNEGVADDRILVTGNTGIDALFYAISRIKQRGSASLLQDVVDALPPGLMASDQDAEPSRRSILVTTHRRESFGADLENICLALKRIANHNPDVDVLYVLHPNPHVQRTVRGALEGVPRVFLLDPMDYLPFVFLMQRSYLVLTDSGGIQEEAPSFGKPVIVLRRTTERTEGITAGTAVLAGVDADAIASITQNLLDDQRAYDRMVSVRNPYGDGHAAKRIVDGVIDWFGRHD